MPKYTFYILNVFYSKSIIKLFSKKILACLTHFVFCSLLSLSVYLAWYVLFSFSLSLKSTLSRQLKCIINSLKLCISCTQRITDNWKLQRVGDKYFPREENTDWLSNSKQPWKHLQTLHRLSRLYDYEGICKYECKTIKNGDHKFGVEYIELYRKVWREERQGEMMWLYYHIKSKKQQCPKEDMKDHILSRV